MTGVQTCALLISSLYIKHVASVGSIGEANIQQPIVPMKKGPQIFTNNDILVPIEVLIKPQIFTNKWKVFFLIQNLATKLVVI